MPREMPRSRKTPTSNPNHHYVSTLLPTRAAPMPRQRAGLEGLVKRQRSESPEPPTELSLPSIPVPIKDFIPYFAKNKTVPVPEILEPFTAYEGELRKFYAQRPDDPILADGLTNMVPVFSGHESDLKIRARKLEEETEEERARYVMPLLDMERKGDETPAVVASLKEFRKNFNIFSESSLAELDWNNVVAAGSSVTTALLPVPEKWNGSKRALREYYHEKLAPASDVDLFLYGLTEEEGLEKIKQIESNIRDSILHEVTTIRTKNAITIVSQYPTRHVQIVLRLYDSISQIITGFDVDCSCAAYDGKQVWASPRALAAFATQINTVDLTRRSPSYENRLSKYSHRGFEVYWEGLDRSRVDPTIFERSFARTLGLARLLVLEKLPKAYHRERYADKRREERGRPAINRDFRMNAMHSGNLKQQEEDEVAEWVEEDQVSDYNTMVVPYGKKFTAAKILRLLYSKDLLLNSEWNRPKDREVNLHRHPCFFGTAEEVLQDCCGYCPVPKTDEEMEIAEQESRLYISGALKFIKDDPGRQEIGSFHPITTDDWTEMGYVGNTQMLCQAIVDGDVEYIKSWLEQEGNNPDTRDYVGRTPLHLAAINGSTEVVKLLVEGGAKLIYRLLDGRSALHIASQLGHADIVKILMDKSLENEDEENQKADMKADELRATKAAAAKAKEVAAAKAARTGSLGSDDIDMVSDEPESDSETLGDEDTDMSDSNDSDSETQGFTKVEKEKPEASNDIPEDNEDEPDFYDINAPAWDLQCAPLHFAIMGGHTHVILMLVEEYGADILLPIKLAKTDIYDHMNKAILPLVLASFAPEEKVQDTVKTLLDLGATTAQADISHFTALHYIVEYNKLDILDLMLQHDGPAAKSALNVIPLSGDHRPHTALSLALLQRHEETAKKLLGLGAKAFVSYEEWIEPYFRKNEYARKQGHEQNLKQFMLSCPQPVIAAAAKELSKIVKEMVEQGADVNTLTLRGQQITIGQQMYYKGHSLLDIVKCKIKKYAEFDAFRDKRQSWERRNEKVKPEVLKDESHYLEGLKPGSYQYWAAKNRFRAVKHLNEQLWANYNEEIAKADEHIEGKKAKMAKAQAIKEELQDLETYLISKGAKTFKELHPDVKEPNDNNYNNRDYRYAKDLDFVDYATTFTFDRPTLSTTEKEGYTRLFEACWRNDIDEVKRLTLAEWTSEDGKKNEPLHVAVQDRVQADQGSYYDGYSGKPPPKKGYSFTGMNPLAIAVLKGHEQLAKVIMEIALAQYEKPDSEKKISKRAKKSQWRLEIVDKDNDEDYDSEEEDGTIRFQSTIVDDIYTIDNVAAISRVTKSSVEPYRLLTWSVNAPWFSSDYDVKAAESAKEVFEEKNTNNRQFVRDWNSFNNECLVEHAVKSDDLPLLRFLWELCPERHDGCEASNGKNTPACLSSGYFNMAIRLGRTSIIAEMIRHLGPHVDDLVTTAPGVVKKEEVPEYYQGLNVGGKKNKAWAEEANPDRQYTSTSDFGRESSLLARAVRYGTLESVQWFLTDLPLQEYFRYAELHPEDENVETLSEAPGGYQKAISDWLNLRKELILHVFLACRRSNDPEDRQILDYLLQKFPELLEKRSIGGLTPLMIAVKLQSKEVMEKLLDAGANPRAKDGNGYNILHYLFKTHAAAEPDFLKARLELFKKDDVQEMLLEPSRDGQLCRQYLMGYGRVLPAQLLIESFISGQDLVLRNSAGDFPLHVAIKDNQVALTKHLLDIEPRVLNWENASGVTAYEFAEAKQLACTAREFEGLSGGRRSYGYNEFDEGDGIELERELEEWEKPNNWEACFGEGTPKGKTQKIWNAVKVVRERLEKECIWKRRLVTLGEANEVAKQIEDGRSNFVRAFAQINLEEKKEKEKEKWDETVGLAI